MEITKQSQEVVEQIVKAHTRAFFPTRHNLGSMEFKAKQWD